MNFVVSCQGNIFSNFEAAADPPLQQAAAFKRKKYEKKSKKKFTIIFIVSFLWQFHFKFVKVEIVVWYCLDGLDP